MPFLWIALGSALGGVARYYASLLIATRFGGDFPLGTMLVNITGCFLIGLFGALTAPTGRFPVPLALRLFFMVGVCGGYTTFSSFSLQTLELTQQGRWLWASLNVLISVSACLFAVWLGSAAAIVLNRR